MIYHSYSAVWKKTNHSGPEWKTQKRRVSVLNVDVDVDVDVDSPGHALR
jgi:hypothetical protein